MLSRCCKHEITVEGTNENSYYYVCAKCGLPCELSGEVLNDDDFNDIF